MADYAHLPVWGYPFYFTYCDIRLSLAIFGEGSKNVFIWFTDKLHFILSAPRPVSSACRRETTSEVVLARAETRIWSTHSCSKCVTKFTTICKIPSNQGSQCVVWQVFPWKTEKFGSISEHNAHLNSAPKSRYTCISTFHICPPPQILILTTKNLGIWLQCEEKMFYCFL